MLLGAPPQDHGYHFVGGGGKVFEALGDEDDFYLDFRLYIAADELAGGCKEKPEEMMEILRLEYTRQTEP